MIPLGLLCSGEQGEILAIRINKQRPSDQSCSVQAKSGCRVEEMGLRVGKFVEMLINGGGLVLVMVDESRIAVDRVIAMKIMVRRKQ
ncbi:MAG: iron transporter FeoA [Geobacteraceae bacterium GWC2_48_7]|nr:MAG: iron transporter FeoA [Geobacteraceae bacterium GWC2_48_7]